LFTKKKEEGGLAAEIKEAEEKNENKKKDNRKRNSLAADMMQYVENVKTLSKFVKEVEEERNKKKKKLPNWEKADVRNQRVMKVADAIACGDFKELRDQVIQNFPKINKHHPEGWLGDTLLHICCREGYHDMVEFMTNPKNRSIFDPTELRIDIRNDKDRTPLHMVFTPPNGTFVCAKYGLNAQTGMPVGEKPEGVVNASDWLQVGGQEERLKILKILLDLGAKVDTPDYHEYTALHYATIWGWTDAVKMLLEYGANVEAVNLQGENVLMIASEYGAIEVVEYLLMETTISLEARDGNGETVLFTAIRKGNVELTRMLVEFGADANVVSFQNMSPLKIACKENNLDIIHLLLDYKAQRRQSAFDFCTMDVRAVIIERIEREKEEARRLAEEEALRARKGLAAKRVTNKSAYQQWVPYNDKRTGKRFYYNKVSRDTQWDMPGDYVRDPLYIIKDATYGMHFYH